MRFEGAGSGKVLDFDIENRPLSYWYDGNPTAEVTSIAHCWVGEPESMRVELLFSWDEGPTEVLVPFLDRFNQADIVTGHFIRGHDLPIVNGALMEMGLPLLSDKMTCDTKLDMFKKSDVPATQEYLLEVLDVRDQYGKPFTKYHMTQHMWREANRLTEDGLRFTKERVQSDVFAHMAMRARMLSLGMLRPPKMWRSGTGAADVTQGRFG